MVPAYDLVYVFRDDTYDFERIPDAVALDLLALILDAKEGEAVDAPALVETAWPERPAGADPAAPRALRLHFGSYVDPRIGRVTLAEVDGEVHLIFKARALPGSAGGGRRGGGGYRTTPSLRAGGRGSGPGPVARRRVLAGELRL